MNKKQIIQQFQAVYSRATDFYKQTNTITTQNPEVMAESLEELRVVLEELCVAEEELLQQNEELMIARAKAEAERQRYYDLFELAPDGYLVTDEAGVIQEANRASARLLNVSKQQFLIGKPLANFIPPEARQTFRSKLNQLRQYDWMPEWELSIVPRNGAAFVAALTASAIRYNRENQPTGWRWLIRDITERKKIQLVETTNQVLEEEIQERQILEQALRQSEERYRVMSELTTDYAYAYSIKPDGTFVPRWFSESFTRVCGYTVEEIAVQGWQSLIPFKDRKIVVEQVKKLLNGESNACEHRIVTKTAEVLWVCNYARPIKEIVGIDGSKRIYGAAQDITERKQIELEREQWLEREQTARIQAETLNHLKDKFLALISQHLRSPLQTILEWTQLLRQGELDEATIARGLEVIEQNAQAQIILIKALLEN